MTPMARTLRLFRERGYKIEIVERYLLGAGIRKDLFGIIDAVAIRRDEIVGVQACGKDFAPHERKLAGEGAEAALAWLSAGGGLVLVGWRPLKAMAGRIRAKYEPRERWFTLADFEEPPAWLE